MDKLLAKKKEKTYGDLSLTGFVQRTAAIKLQYVSKFILPSDFLEGFIPAVLSGMAVSYWLCLFRGILSDGVSELFSRWVREIFSSRVESKRLKFPVVKLTNVQSLLAIEIWAGLKLI